MGFLAVRGGIHGNAAKTGLGQTGGSPSALHSKSSAGARKSVSKHGCGLQLSRKLLQMSWLIELVV